MLHMALSLVNQEIKLLRRKQWRIWEFLKEEGSSLRQEAALPQHEARCAMQLNSEWS